MGSRRDDGGWSSDGDSSDDLPDLPEEWGVIVIPDDLSELSDEVAAIRAELRQTVPRTKWRRLTFGRAGYRVRRFVTAGVRAPVLIISMAVLVTVASLFASAWPGPPRNPTVQRTADTTSIDDQSMLPALEVIGADGKVVPLLGQLPEVVLIIDGCDCQQLVTDTAAAVRPGVTVVTVTSGAAPTASTPAVGAGPRVPGSIVSRLRDPAGTLRERLRLGTPDGTAAVLLVNRTGTIVRRLPRTASVADFEPDLARL